jgi:hypothetical protein
MLPRLNRVIRAAPDFDSQEQGVLRETAMDETTEVCAIRNPDGTVRLCVDEAYALDSGVDPARLVKVHVPRDIVANGSVTQIGEYIASYLESQTRSAG